MVKLSAQAFTENERRLLFGVAAFGLLLGPVQSLADRIEITQAELGVNRGNVCHGIHAPLDVRDVLVFEAAHHMCDRVYFADVRQELVAEPLAFGSAADQARNVDESNGSGYDPVGLVERGERIQSSIRYRHDADVRLDSAEGEVLRFGFG